MQGLLLDCIMHSVQRFCKKFHTHYSIPFIPYPLFHTLYSIPFIPYPLFHTLYSINCPPPRYHLRNEGPLVCRTGIPRIGQCGPGVDLYRMCDCTNTMFTFHRMAWMNFLTMSYLPVAHIYAAAPIAFITIVAMP